MIIMKMVSGINLKIFNIVKSKIIIKILNITFISLFLFNFQNKSFSNEITEFEIEGFTIYQNLIDFFDEKQIKEEMNSKFAVYYKDKKFVDITVGPTNDHPMKKDLTIYEEVVIAVKPNDKKYKIYSVGGSIICDTEKECHKTSEEIIDDLKEYFGSSVDVYEWEDPYLGDKSGKSRVYGNELTFSEIKDSINVNFYQMDKEYADSTNSYYNYLIVSLSSFEFDEFLKNEAYD